MKELSIEERAQRYDEALERAKNIKTGKCETTFIFTEGLFNYLFPELEECNGEEVRKAMIDFFKHEREEGVVVTHYGVNIERMIAWLEKQGEQKPADRVKPKFQKGDWITNGYDTWEIIEVKPLAYILQSQDGKIEDDTISYINETYDSFTIEDAEDGDVLADNVGVILFKGIGDNNVINYYAYFSGLFAVQEGEHYWGHIRESTLSPTTKEQRERFFAAMHDAGYEWDAEKKELKRIENEIEIPLGAKDSKLQEATYFIPKGFHAEIDDDKVVIKKGEKPTAWSEEDENILEAITYTVKNSGYSHCIGVSIKVMIAWLKSLKQRIGG